MKNIVCSLFSIDCSIRGLKLQFLKVLYTALKISNCRALALKKEKNYLLSAPYQERKYSRNQSIHIFVQMYNKNIPTHLQNFGTPGTIFLINCTWLFWQFKNLFWHLCLRIWCWQWTDQANYLEQQVKKYFFNIQCIQGCLPNRFVTC